MGTKILEGVALESIKFQSGIFFKELAELYRVCHESKLNESKLAASELVEALSKCIKHHTGLNAFISVEDNGPAVMIPFVHKNHPFIEEANREFFGSGDVYEAMKAAGGVLKGTVNLATSKVTGIFGEIESKIMMPYEWVSGKLGVTPEECAAVTLHEVGHLFTYYEYISRTTTTNQVLAALSRGYAKADSIDERGTLLISAKKALQLKQEGIDDLAKSANIEVVASVILTNLVEKSRTELGVNIYDLNSWEYLADEFAARHQAGRHLITGLNKLYIGSNHMSYRTNGQYLFMEALKIAVTIAGIMSAPFIGGWSLLPILYGYGMFCADSDVIIYDEPEARARRVKQQLIECLKDKRLSKDDITRINEDIKMIDEILAVVKDKRQLIGILYDNISAKGRKARASVVLQQQLETIANNALFAKAAQFKAIEV